MKKLQSPRRKTAVILTALIAVLLSGAKAFAQAIPTADRLLDIQTGVDFSIVKPDYGTSNWHAYGFYADVDVRRHYGLEFNFKQSSGPQPLYYERTYQVGPRFVFPIKQRFAPYAKVMVGRGVFNFAGTNTAGDSVQVANLAYNTVSIGGGLDLKIRPNLNIRAFDYEYSRWPSFPSHGLTPSSISFGVAYHFNGELFRKK